MKIYTKTGDKGKTGLIGGTRVAKSDLRIEAYGTVDELNSHIGLLISYPHTRLNSDFLIQIQHLLFAVGSHLATDTTVTNIKEVSVVSESDIRKVESEIDRLNQELPELRQFILPGGAAVGAQSHICRTVARRAERRIVEMNENYPIDIEIIKYINRLSDYFFVLSRYLTLEKGHEEIFWKK
ncbi:MAG: cob(I)yrinic acid a,c-diamide adenosyltransferase [Paludibacteraceae bacterium]|nr:cob(I)yrinic acid a,c-diamide adenosyltransferase [Paludibacteraceae bacterium]